VLLRERDWGERDERRDYFSSLLLSSSFFLFISSHQPSLLLLLKIGIFDLMSNQERVEKMGDEIKRRNRDRFLYSPPGRMMMVDGRWWLMVW